MLTVVPLTVDDLAQVASITTNMQRAYFSPGSVAYCLLHDDKPVLAGGIVNMMWNRGEAWVIPNRFMKRNIRLCIGIMGDVLKRAALEGGFKRVQATCATSVKVGLFRRLGFYYEGTMNHFGPNGETCFMYARIFD